MIDSLSSPAQKAMDEALSLSATGLLCMNAAISGCSALQRGGIPQSAPAV